jgi:hypothetical protein
MTGDAFHNLRSGLDHLIYAVAIHEIDSTALPGLLKTFAFPICDTAHDFKSKFWRIAPLSDPVRTLIESLQPYNRPHPTFPPLLAVLRDFDDIDKHRLLQLAIAQLIEGEIAKISAVIPPGEQMTVLSHVGEVVDGTEILVIIPTRPTPDMRYYYTANLGISLPHATGPLDNKRSEVLFLFNTLRDEVTLVIEKFKRLFP